MHIRPAALAAAALAALASAPGARSQDLMEPWCARAHFEYGRALEASRLCGTPQPFFVDSDPDCAPAAGGSAASRIQLAGKESLDRETIAGPRGGVRRFCAGSGAP